MKERRFLTHKIELRSDGEAGKPRVIRGYAAKFNTESNDMGWGDYEFREVIEPGAFADVLKDDVRALFNHDSNHVLARSRDGRGTLRMGEDSVGLWYEFDAPDTQLAADLVVSMQRGDIDQSSFQFAMKREGEVIERTEQNGKTRVKRTIKKVSRLYDVSIVTFPAYDEATAELRSHVETELKRTSAPVEGPASDGNSQPQKPTEDLDLRLRVLSVGAR
jgi:HK97 family phage prohead protease